MTETLKNYRETYKISMEEWAKMMGVDVKTACAWEEGTALPNTVQLHKICKFTGMGISCYLNKNELREYNANKRGMFISLVAAQLFWLFFSAYAELVLLQPLPTLGVSLSSAIVICEVMLPLFLFLLFTFISAGIGRWYRRSRVVIGLVTVFIFLLFCVIGLIGGRLW